MSKRIRMKKTKIEVQEYPVTARMVKFGHVPEGYRSDKHMMVMLEGRVTVVRRDSVEDVK